MVRSDHERGDEPVVTYRRFPRVILLGAFAGLSGACSGSDPSEDAPFSDETVEIIVPFREGGGSDTYARAVAPFLQKHLGADVRVRVLNVLGASGIQGGNEFGLRRDPDGLSLFMSSGSNSLPFLLGEPAVRYDFNDFAAILGSPTGGVVYAAPANGVRDIPTLCSAEGLIYGGISPTGLDMVPLVAFALLDLDVQSILGYQGKGAARVAFEQGETNLDYQTSPAYLTNVVPLVEAGTAIPLFSFGQVDADGRVVRDPVFPDLPSFAEALETCTGMPPSGPGWDAYRAVLVAGFSAQKNLWTHRGAPEPRIAALRAAGRATIQDPEFLSMAQELLGGYEFSIGEDVEDTFRQASSIGEDAKAWLLALLRERHDVAL